MKFEKYIFYFLVFVHLIPVLILPYFVTHDGPSHVNNSEQVFRMFFHGDTAASHFLQFNPQILPNWIGHFLQMIFSLIFESANAERLIVAIYIIAFPLAFRALVLAINPNAFAASYLVFPFVQAFTLLLGFFSFCLGVCMLFFILSQWQKKDFLPDKKKFLWFSLLMIFLYFSHLFVFMLSIFSLVLMMSWRHLTTYGPSMNAVFSNINKWWKQIVFLIGVALVPLLFTFLFSFHQASKTTSEFPEFATMWMLFKDVRPIIALNYDLEKIYSQPLFYTYALLFIGALIWKIRFIFNGKKKLFETQDGWLILSIIMTIFYFVLPDDIFSGGILAIRFCLFAYLFLFLWLAAYSPAKILLVGAALSVLASVLLLNLRFSSLKNLSEEAEDLASCSDKIRPGSILMTLNYSDNWMLDNICGYLGGNKDIMLLDNYEANQVHFPLMWRQGRNPEFILGNASKSNRPCVDIEKFKKISGVNIEYILVMKRPQELNDSCSLSVDAQMKFTYKEIFVTPKKSGVLYERIM